MLYQPSLLRLSFLVLTCASPTLGAVEEPSSTTSEPQSTVASVPQPLLRVHRHHHHRQQRQVNLIPQAAGGDPRTQLPAGIPGSLPQTRSAMLPPTSPVKLSPISAAILPPPGPGSLSSTGPAILPSKSSATLIATNAAGLSPAVPTQSGFPTANQDASVTAVQFQTAGPLGIGIPDNRINDPPSAPDPNVDAEDQTDLYTTIEPSLNAENSSTSTATLPVDSPVSFSLDSFMPTLTVPVTIPAGIPSSGSRSFTTSLTFPVVAPTPAPAASRVSSSRLTLSLQSSSTPLSASPASGSPTLGSIASVSVVLPTSSPSGATNRDLNHPNPASSSPQAERSKKAAVLAGFLILGTLGAIGVALLCSYCGLSRCRRRRRNRGISSADRIAEEGLNDDDPPKLVRVNLDEKWSIVPGSPPPTDLEDFVDTLPRDAHVHTLSCSTCPPDSLNGVRGGVPGGGNRAPGQLDPGWVFPNHLQLANLALQPQGESTTTGTSLAFTNVHLQGPETPSQSSAFPIPTPEWSAPGSGGTPPDKSPVAGRISTSGDSYMTCDSASKYSMASGRRASGVESVVGTSESDKDSGIGNASSGTAGAVSERPSTPDASHSSSTTGSPSILMTPQQPARAADVALPASSSPSPASVRGGLAIARSGQAAEGFTGEDPEWDVVATYSHIAREEVKGTSVGELIARSREMPPTPGQKGLSQKAARKKNVRERRATGVGIEGKSRVVGPLTLGDKKVMVVHGA